MKLTKGTNVLFYNEADTLELVKLQEDTEFNEEDVVNHSRGIGTLFEGFSSVIVGKGDHQQSFGKGRSGEAVLLILNKGYEIITAVPSAPSMSLFTKRPFALN